VMSVFYLLYVLTIKKYISIKVVDGYIQFFKT